MYTLVSHMARAAVCYEVAKCLDSCGYISRHFRCYHVTPSAQGLYSFIGLVNGSALARPPIPALHGDGASPVPASLLPMDPQHALVLVSTYPAASGVMPSGSDHSQWLALSTALLLVAHSSSGAWPDGVCVGYKRGASSGQLPSWAG